MSINHNFEEHLDDVLEELGDFLKDKNRKYGNSALSPVRIFSKAEWREQLMVRMDDKLSRLRASQGDDTEDAKFDLLGYLILERVGMKLRETEKTLVEKWGELPRGLAHSDD